MQGVRGPEQPHDAMTNKTLAPLTTRARVALATARGIAAAFGHHELRPVHVALGLIREGENPAVAVLHASGAAVPTLRRDLEALLEPRGQTRPREVVLPLTAGEERVVEAAATQALLRNDEFVGPHHLLLALLADESEATSQLFTRHGVSYQSATTHLQAILHGPHS